MENKAGKITGFVLGLGGFLLLFKAFVLVNISPEDEIAPGIVVFVAVLNGFLFAWVGHLIQNSVRRGQMK